MELGGAQWAERGPDLRGLRGAALGNPIGTARRPCCICIRGSRSVALGSQGGHVRISGHRSVWGRTAARDSLTPPIEALTRLSQDISRLSQDISRLSRDISRLSRVSFSLGAPRP